MKELDQPVPESEIVDNEEDALRFAESIGFPVILRPAYTLGGKGGGIAKTKEAFQTLIKQALLASPISQCLVEKASPVLKKSNTRSCATKIIHALPSATWKTSIPSACIQETLSSLHRPRR